MTGAVRIAVLAMGIGGQYPMVISMGWVSIVTTDPDINLAVPLVMT